MDNFLVGHQHGLGPRANVLPLVPDALWNQALTFSRNNSQGKTDIKSINIVHSYKMSSLLQYSNINEFLGSQT